MNETQLKTNSFMIPFAIIIAGILIAGSVFIVNGRNNRLDSTLNTQLIQKVPQSAESLNKIDSVTLDDHILGNPDAPIKIVEYSDAECPFCKRFHQTMKRIMEEYGKDGRVAWVYRPFPIDQLHPKNGRKVAVASECVNEIAGNNAFWKFTDRFFELTPSNDQTDLKVVIPQILNEIGVDKSRFNICAESGKYDKHVQDSIDNAIATGASGTPWSIVIAENGEMFPINGAQSYNTVKKLIELSLNE